jgi:hypothetical protein
MVVWIFPAGYVQKQIVMFVNMLLKRKWSGQWKIFQATGNTMFR